MNEQTTKDVQVAAWPSRRRSLIALAICAFACFGLSYFGPRFHPDGEAAKSDVPTVNWTILLTFLPFYSFIPIYMGVKGWQRRKQDRIYRWQALVLSWGVIILCVITVLDFGYITLFAPYSKSLPAEGRIEGGIYPREMSLAWRAQDLFSLVTFFLIILITTGFLGPDRLDEE